MFYQLLSSLLTKFNIVIVVHELIANVLSTEDEEERERKEIEEIEKHLIRQKIGKTVSLRLLSLLEGWRVSEKRKKKEKYVKDD